MKSELEQYTKSFMPPPPPEQEPAREMLPLEKPLDPRLIIRPSKFRPLQMELNAEGGGSNIMPEAFATYFQQEKPKLKRFWQNYT